MNRRLSLVAEHLSRKQKVKGSIPLIAFHFFFKSQKGQAKKRKNARSGVRTHASEENSTLNYRLRPLGHPCFQGSAEKGVHKGSVCMCGVTACVSKRSDPGGGRTHDLLLRRQLRFHCATRPSVVRSSKVYVSVRKKRKKRGRLQRDSNPRPFAY